MTTRTQPWVVEVRLIDGKPVDVVVDRDGTAQVRCVDARDAERVAKELNGYAKEGRR